MISRYSRIWPLSVLLGAFILSACTTPPPPPPPPERIPAVKIVLLPQEDASRTGLVVRTEQGEQNMLTQPYERSTVTTRSQPVKDNITAQDVSEQYDTLFKVAPQASKRWTLFFEVGGTQLTAESQQKLPAILEDAAQRPGGEILVIGHTDTKGKKETNDALSLRRAQTVSALLQEAKKGKARIEAIGRGQRELAVPTADNVDEPRNRRVEILVR